MTLEILQDVKGIENLFVYGNEYLEVSAEKANAVLDHLAPAHGRKGVICTADSTDLGFIPADSFDLVYTGYLRYVYSTRKESDTSCMFLQKDSWDFSFATTVHYWTPFTLILERT
jgi:hypothetical protein